MLKILILSETYLDDLKTVSYEMISKIRSLNTQASIEVAIFQDVTPKVQEQLKKWGIAQLHILKGSTLQTYSPEGYTHALKEFFLQHSFDYVFAGATSLFKDLIPRVCGALEVGQATEITDLKFDQNEFVGTRPMFAGKVLCQVRITGKKPHFFTVRSNAFAVNLMQAQSESTLNIQDHMSSSCDMKAVIKEIIKGASQKLDLTEAKIIVSGGRAMKSAENFKILHELADVLGATVGASRAAVDSGYATHSMQVGQTGKTVSPSLYIACGISGAIQHLAGMRTSKYIVAINTDPEAPIFSKADYGIVGDLFEVVPALTAALKETAS